MSLDVFLYRYRYLINILVVSSIFVFSYVFIAHGYHTHLPTIYFYGAGEFFGSAAEFFFFVVVGTALLNNVFRNNYVKTFVNNKEILNIHERLKSLYFTHKPYVLLAHIISAVLLVLFSTLHFLSMKSNINVFLLSGWLSLIYASFVGLMLKFLNNKLKFYGYLFHVQWVVVGFAVISLLLGHGLVEEYEEWDID